MSTQPTEISFTRHDIDIGQSGLAFGYKIRGYWPERMIRVIQRLSHDVPDIEWAAGGRDMSEEPDNIAAAKNFQAALKDACDLAHQIVQSTKRPEGHEHCDPTAFHFFGPRWAIRAASLSDALVTFRRLQGYDLHTLAPNRIAIVTPQGTVFAVPEGSLVRYSHVVSSTAEAEGLVEFLRIQGRYDVGES